MEHVLIIARVMNSDAPAACMRHTSANEPRAPTGDNPLTALRVATDVAMVAEGTEVFVSQWDAARGVATWTSTRDATLHLDPHTLHLPPGRELPPSCSSYELALTGDVFAELYQQYRLAQATQDQDPNDADKAAAVCSSPAPFLPDESSTGFATLVHFFKIGISRDALGLIAMTTRRTHGFL